MSIDFLPPTELQTGVVRILLHPPAWPAPWSYRCSPRRSRQDDWAVNYTREKSNSVAKHGINIALAPNCKKAFPK